MMSSLLTLACAPFPTVTDTDSGTPEGDPRGTWIHVAVADYFGCALDSEGRPHCWGDGSGGIMMGSGADPTESMPELTDQTRILANHYNVCTTSPEGIPTCWGNTSLGMDPQPTRDLTLSSAGTCILTDEDQIVCGSGARDWPDELLDIPAKGLPDHVDSLFCTIGTDGEANCIDSLGAELLDPVPGPFEEIACANDQCCGIRSDGALQCGMYDEVWRSEYFDLAPAEITGPWHGLTAYTGAFCALDSEDLAHCWSLSDGWDEALGSPPPTPFIQIDAGFLFACGVTLEGEIECWGRNDAGQQDVPEL